MSPALAAQKAQRVWATRQGGGLEKVSPKVPAPRGHKRQLGGRVGFHPPSGAGSWLYRSPVRVSGLREML